MVTKIYDRECPVDGCPYKNHVEGKFASLEDVLNHVTAEHKEDHMIPKTAWDATCEMKGCMKKFKDKSLLSLFRTFIEHNKQAHGTWIDPETCEVCAERRIDETMEEIHNSPKKVHCTSPGRLIQDGGKKDDVNAGNINVDDMTEFQYYQYVTKNYGPIVGEEMERKLEYRLFR